MMPISRFTLAAACGALAATLAQAQEGPPMIAMEDVPPEALAAAREVVGEGELGGLAEIDLDDGSGQVVYEFTGTMPDGRRVEVDVLPDGTVREVEHELPPHLVPPQAMAAVLLYLPDFRPVFIERSKRVGAAVGNAPPASVSGSVWYELEGLAPDGEEIEVHVNGTGDQVLIRRRSHNSR